MGRYFPRALSPSDPPCDPALGHAAPLSCTPRFGVHAPAGQAGFSCYNPRASGKLRLPRPSRPRAATDRMPR
jgi:hypothetical protein